MHRPTKCTHASWTFETLERAAACACSCPPLPPPPPPNSPRAFPRVRPRPPSIPNYSYSNYCTALLVFSAQEPLYFVRSLSPSGTHALRIRALSRPPPRVLHLEVPTTPLILLLVQIKNADLSYCKLMILIKQFLQFIHSLNCDHQNHLRLIGESNILLKVKGFNSKFFGLMFIRTITMITDKLQLGIIRVYSIQLL